MISLLLAGAVGQYCVPQQQAVGYAQPYYQQTYANAYVEKAVFVAVEDPADYYTGLVGQSLRTAKRQEAAAQVQATTDAKLDQLTRLVQQLQQRLETQRPAPANELPVPQPRRTAPPVPSPSPGLSSYPISESVPPPPLVPNRTRDAAVAILTSSCAKCHSGESPSGSFAIFDRRGQLANLSRDQLDSISEQVWQGKMPKSLPLPARDQIVIRAWIAEAGKEQVAAVQSAKVAKR